MSDAFEPIAIVGQGCVLPGAFTPSELWRLINANQCSITDATADDFGLLKPPLAQPPYASGFVRGFEHIFDPAPFETLDFDLSALGPPCTWPLHAAHAAWQEAKLPPLSSDRIGVCTGNLGYPSQLKSRFGADIWRSGRSERNPLTSFNASFSTHLIARHIGATGPVIALDAACASSLYALEMACRKLHARQIDVALVAAINTADNLTLHIGFDALQALSPTRQSRPFHKDADGLIPSEGAAALVLKRHTDIDPADTVHGVIRAIGLSNDGNRKGLLAPSAEGQTEAMKAAWQAANLSPESIDYLECHATGTPTGDTVELRAAQSFFAAKPHLPIGSLKANLGHSITVAGLASILKMTAAMAHEVYPSTPLNGVETCALNGSNLLVQRQATAWTSSKGPRRAGISNFGFGGNNAHLILDQYQPARRIHPVIARPAPDPIVILDATLLRGDAITSQTVVEHLLKTPDAPFSPMVEIGVDAIAARTPPIELSAAEPQQLVLLQTAHTCLSRAPINEREATAVFVTNSTSFEFCRFLVDARSHHTQAEQLSEPLAAKHVLGAMANMSANRITFANNLRGRGVSILSDGAGDAATLDAAITALNSGSLKVAIVASAQLPDDTPTHTAKVATKLPTEKVGHAACLILMRQSDADAQGLAHLGTFSDFISGAQPDATAQASTALIFDIAAACWLFQQDDRRQAEPIQLTAPATFASTGATLAFAPSRIHTAPNSDSPRITARRRITYPHPETISTECVTMPESSPPLRLPIAPPRPAPDYPSTQVHQTQAHIPKHLTSGATELARRTPTGPRWEKDAIERASTGPISELFGPRFRQQDNYKRVVRLPARPLLFVDRIAGIDAKLGVSGKGTIWTQTHLNQHAWAHHGDHMRPGPLIECGQADLSLISYMGADFLNRDQRVYRLLGCEITFHEPGLPFADGDLDFQIEIVDHAVLGKTRLFFFQYDAYKEDRLVFSVRNGQAGFFTTEELVSAKGINCEAGKMTPPSPSPSHIETSYASAKSAFTQDEVEAFRHGDAFACFGAGFERAAAHSRPPHLPKDKLALFDHVERFEPTGGPWQRGYLKAIAYMPTNHWLYDGHFHNDPCMPGTMMAEAAIQALEFHAAAMGLTLDQDGYIFEPLPGHTAEFICRGQVTPDTDHTLSYEVFIDKIITGDKIEIHAALLASCDERKVFLCPHFAIRARPAWPRTNTLATPEYIGPTRASRGDLAALLACADGAPSDAFGEMYTEFDKAGRVPRLPGQPYHMMTCITHVSSAPGDRKIGASLQSEYEIRPDAWYFDDNQGVMPLSVLTEIALQPCGWLASHCGFALDGGSAFRNLEGDGVVLRSPSPKDGILITNTRLSAVSKIGAMTIVSFELSVSTQLEETIFSLTTQFGFFPPEALARQAGLAPTPEDAASFQLPALPHSLPAYSTSSQPGRLRMLDKVDYFNSHGGRAGLGIIRARQEVDPYAWYFKSHFFQDPVQPGSLGLDAMIQALQCAIEMKQGLPNGLYTMLEARASGYPVKWSYRGQVTPDAKEVVTIVEVTDISTDAQRTCVSAHGSLWCDGKRIYEMPCFSLARSAAQQ